VQAVAPTAAPQTTGPTTVTVTVTGPGVAPATPALRAPDPRSASRKPAASAPATAIAAASAATAPASAPAETPPAAARVPTLAELPDAIRQQVPPLTLGGGVYSTQATQRLVIVNGQVVHEGDQPAAGLRVVQIRPRSVVFSFRGQQFELGL
jgi:general secretion pathway protein B